MKIFAFLLFSPFCLFAQVGIGTTNPNPKSMLEISSTSDGGATYKAFMPPRVPTNTERDAINPGFQDVGLLVFVLQTGCLHIWDGNSWEDISCITVAQPEIWINEFHYDNIGTDVNEGFEIAGAASTDLSTYSVYLYNGLNGQTYNTVINLSGSIDNESNGFGAISFILATDGLQNGAPDGLMLYNNSTATVVQFLSYEGSFVATNGPANGATTNDIGVTESNTTTAVGTSLQLTGTGNEYSQFNWNTPLPASFGTLNAGQIIN